MTPFRVCRALFRQQARKTYGRTYRKYVWEVATTLAKEANFDCRLDPSLRMRVSTLDQTISRHIFIDGTFGASELEHIRNTVRVGSKVVDVGANIGIHTLALAHCVGPAGTVYSFEPSAAYERLVRNVALNGFESRTRLNRIALGDKEGTLQLALTAAGMEGFTSCGGRPDRENVWKGKWFEAPMQTLDGFAAQHRIEVIDFMKMDTEGAEVRVLHGATRLLRERVIRNVLFEVNETCLYQCGSSPAELIRIFRDNGFTLRVLETDGAFSPCPAELVGDNIMIVGTISSDQL